VDARTGDNGCLEDAEEGNVVGMRPFKAHAPDTRAIGRKLLVHWQTHPSLGPLTRARRSSLHTGGKTVWWWRINAGIEVGQAWDNQEEPAAGSARMDAARLAARHRFRKGEGVDA